MGSSWTRDWTRVSCTGRQILYHWATREALSCASDHKHLCNTVGPRARRSGFDLGQVDEVVSQCPHSSGSLWGSQEPVYVTCLALCLTHLSAMHSTALGILPPCSACRFLPRAHPSPALVVRVTVRPWWPGGPLEMAQHVDGVTCWIAQGKYASAPRMLCRSKQPKPLMLWSDDIGLDGLWGLFPTLLSSGSSRKRLFQQEWWTRSFKPGIKGWYWRKS